MEENYKIELGNGTVLDGLILNGTDFMTKQEISEDTFEDMGTATITDGSGVSTVYEHPELIHCSLFPDKYYHFALKNLSDAEIKALNNDAQIFYTAVMTDTLMEV